MWEQTLWQLVKRGGHAGASLIVVAGALAASACGVATAPASDPAKSTFAASYPDDGETVRQTVLASGADWRLVNVSGYAVDDGGQYFDNNLYMLHNGGIYQVSLPPGVADDLSYDLDPYGDTVFTVDDRILQEIAASESYGYLTDALIAIAEPGEGEPPPPDPCMQQYRSGSGSRYPTDECQAWRAARREANKNKPKDTSRLFGRCSNRVITKGKTLDLAQPITLQSADPGGGFSGSLSVSGNMQGTATAEINLALKRFALFGACIPYGIKLENARAYGDILFNNGVTVSGTVNWSGSIKPIQIAKPPLFSVIAMIGPIPVLIGFNLPITIGMDISASGTGSITYNGSQNGFVRFNYTCTLGGCNGSSVWDAWNTQVAQPTTSGFSGRLELSPYVQAAIRGYLWKEELAYAQVGVRPYLRGDFWYFNGNNCGDATSDGWYEHVTATTIDLDWQFHVTAEANAFDSENPKRWNLWNTRRFHLGFWPLGESPAITPMLSGPQATPPGFQQALLVKMRPCWPYGDQVDYRMDWGDGTSVEFSGAPNTWKAVAHAWPSPTTVTVAATALRDSHGRKFNHTTARPLSIDPNAQGQPYGVWTEWLDRDDPSGSGDWETLGDFLAMGKACPTPLAIECRTLSGVDWTAAGEVYTCSVDHGGICRNDDQPDGWCNDYQVRFLCP